MRRPRHLAWLTAALAAVLAAGPLPAGSAGGPEILFPTGRNHLVDAADHLIVLGPGGADWASLELSRVVQRRAVRAVNFLSHRTDLAQLVRGLFRENFRVNRIDIELAAGAPGVKPLSLSETIKEERGLNLQEFWASPAFARIYTAAARDSLASKVSVTLTGRELTRAARGTGGCGATILRLSLDPGLNEVLLRSLDTQGRVLGETGLSYLYRPGGVADSTEAGLHAASRFHAGNWQSCASCHRLEPGAEEAANPRGATRSCLPCHQRLLEHRVTHKPVQALTCMGCHAVPASEDGVTARAACTGCHTAFRQAAAASPRVHPLTRDGRCTVCHDPHGSELDARLREDVHTLCTSCHSGRYEESHPVLQHPVRAVDDPLAPGRELDCVSCHDPHASSEPSLLKVVDGRVRRCGECHPK
jgi:predicted CXXCH cytochrome family protein